MSKAQADISSLVEEFLLLRRDTIALLENQRSFRRETQEYAPAVEHAAMEEADKPRNNCSKRVTRSFKTIRNRCYQDSHESELDDINDEFVMDDDHVIRTECQQEIWFFGRKKGPRHEGLMVTKSSYPEFGHLMNYRYYRFINTSYIRLAEEGKKLREQFKIFQAMFENTKFSGADPFMAFKFLTTLVEEADKLSVSEAHTLFIMPKLLSRRAERHPRSIRKGARSGDVTCWPEIVKYFLCTYATPAALRNAVNDLESIRRQR